MNNTHSKTQLNARTFWRGKIRLLSGLHIGGSQGGIDIGGVDLTIVRNPFNRQPYIPGSSIKGKLRSLLEKAYGLPQNEKLGDVRIHICEDPKQYQSCPVCPLFGVPAETKFPIPTPTRIVARDAHLTDDSRRKLEGMKLDTDFAEIKTEVVIDRITSHAMPRSQERVPAGVEFEFELVASLYDNENGKRLELVLEAMQLLEGDFLGGQGSRGSGKIEFCNLSLEFVPTQPYDLKKSVQLLKEKSLAQVVEDMSWLQQIQEQLKPAKA